MNAIGQDMFSGNPIAGYISLGIIGYFILGTVVEMLFGCKRGWKRQLVHLGFSALGLLGSFIITEILINSIVPNFDSQDMADILATLEGWGLTLVADAKEALLSVDPNLAALILALPAATVLAPLVFTVVFILLNLVLKLISLIVLRIFPKAKGAPSRLIGMAVGIVEGVLVTSLVLLPVAACADLASGIVSTVDETAAEEGDASSSTEIHAFLDEYLDPISKNPILTLTRTLGGEAMINSFATLELRGVEVDMRREIYGAVDILTSTHGFADINWEKLDESDKRALDTIIDSISDSEYLAEVFSGVFKTLYNLSEEGTSVSLVSESDGELMVALFDDIIYILGRSTRATVGEDLTTFKEILYILSDGDVIAAFNGGVSTEIMIDVLNTKYDEEHTIITKLITTIRENERTKPLIATLTKLSITIMAEDMGLGEEADALYDNVIDGLSGINDIDPDSYATPEEYTAAVSDSIKDTLTSNGITVEQEMIDSLADFAAQKHKADGDLSEDDVQDVILEYYAICANSTANP
ncbi:MAG: CvpA family protein [Clostridia bacterium]|nr:CvpA family protein [Clostridia bacterium]